MDGACSTKGRDEKLKQIISHKTLREESLGRTRPAWEDNIKIYL